MTVIHHNSEERIRNSGNEAVASYLREVTYFISMDHIKAIKDDSSYCRQFLKVECLYSYAMLSAYWLSVDKERISYDYDEPQGDPPCLCRMRTAACDVTGELE